MTRTFSVIPDRRLILDILLVLMSAICVVMALRFSTVSTLGDLLISFGIIAFAAVLLIVPVQWLPATALTTFAVLPNSLVPNDGIWRAVPAVGVIMILWVIRRLAGDRREQPSMRSRAGSWVVVARVVAGCFIVWALMTALRVPALLQESSYGWISSITISAFAVLAIPFAHREAALLTAAWMRVAAILGLYAMLEIAVGSSPFYATLYQALGLGSNVGGGSSFRAQAGFGHPLWAAAFFVPPAVLGLIHWMQGGPKRELAFGLSAVGGAVATLSRGSIVAIAVGVGAAIVLATFQPAGRRWARMAMIVVGGCCATLAILVFPPLVARLEGVGASLSAGARTIGLHAAFQAAADSSWLGTGASTSGITGRMYTSVVIENSFAQLLISVGVPGLLLFSLTVVALVLNALHGRDIASAMALLAYVIAISTFNSIEGVRSMHLILGLLFLLCMSPTPPLPRAAREVPAFGRIPWLPSEPAQSRM